MPTQLKLTILENERFITYHLLKNVSSPKYKKCKRRGRSISEAQSLSQLSITSTRALFREPKQHLQNFSENRYTSLSTASLSDFQPNAVEMDVLYSLQKLYFSYIGIKNAMQTTEYLDGNLSLSLQSFLKVKNTACSNSLYTYMNVLDKDADIRDTIAGFIIYV